MKKGLIGVWLLLSFLLFHWEPLLGLDLSEVQQSGRDEEQDAEQQQESDDDGSQHADDDDAEGSDNNESEKSESGDDNAGGQEQGGDGELDQEDASNGSPSPEQEPLPETTRQQLDQYADQLRQQQRANQHYMQKPGAPQQNQGDIFQALFGSDPFGGYSDQTGGNERDW